MPHENEWPMHFQEKRPIAFPPPMTRTEYRLTVRGITDFWGVRKHLNSE